MNKKYISTFFITITFLLQACKKDSDLFIPDPGQVTGPDTTWYDFIAPSMPVAALRNNLLLDPQKDSFSINTSNYITVAFPSGLQCSFPPLSLVKSNGSLATGTVHIESLLLKKKGDMIRMDRPTVSNGRLLVSGGSFLINVQDSGNALRLAPSARIYARYPENSPSSAMQLFNGDLSDPQRFNWVRNQDTANNSVSPGLQGIAGYEIMSNNLQWINCDYFYDTAVARTVISAALPNHYTNANTMVYLVFRDIRSITGMYGNASVRRFNSIAVPVGQAVTVLVISKQGDDYYLGHENAVTTNLGTNYQPVPVTPVRSTLNEIIQYLNSL